MCLAHVPPEVIKLEYKWNESFHIFWEVFKLGKIPFPSDITPSHQVKYCTNGKAKCIQSLRNERDSNKPNNLKEIMRAND